MNKRYAFLLSCNNYRSLRPLEFCVKDMNLFRDTLVSHCDYEPHLVNSLELTPEDDNTPTKIRGAIEEIASKTKPGDTLLFYFAGHGHGVDSEGYLLLPRCDLASPEGEGLSISELAEAMKVPGRTCVRIFDACHSGLGARDANERTPDTAEFSRAVKEDGATTQGAVTLAACTGTEHSYEDAALQHGYYTYALAEVLKGWTISETISCGTLHDRVCEKVKDLMQDRGQVQTPVMYGAQEGSPSIARRVVARLPQAPIAEPPVMLDARLAKARQSEAKFTSARMDELNKLPPVAVKLLKDRNESWAAFAIEPRYDYGSSGYWPKNLVAPLVTHFESLGVVTHHTIESYIEDGKTMMQRVKLTMDPPDRQYRLHSGQWPNCVARIEWSGDQFAPSGHGGIYFVPLQTRMYVVVWGKVNSWLPDRRKLIRVYEGFVEVDADWASLLKPHIDSLIDALVDEVSDSVGAKLDYLDIERSK